MTKKEIVLQMLDRYSCVTANQLSGFIKRTTGEDMSPASVGGQLRSLVNQGKVGKSNLTGKTVYWRIKEVA